MTCASQCVEVVEPRSEQLVDCLLSSVTTSDELVVAVVVVLCSEK